MRLIFIPIHVFRETPAVTFFDASVEGSNGTDVVAHHGAAISPPDDLNGEQYYVRDTITSGEQTSGVGYKSTSSYLNGELKRI